MKVLGGIHKGKTLLGFTNNKLRPTSSKVKEALFNIIYHNYNHLLLDGNFLDVFAGTGAIAAEAVSRGAKSVTLVEQSSLHINLIKKNLSCFKHELIKSNFFKLTTQQFNSKFSLVFLDPPYNQNLLPKALTHLISLNILEAKHLIITEGEKKALNIEELNSILKQEKLPTLKLVLQRNYGIKQLNLLEVDNTQ